MVSHPYVFASTLLLSIALGRGDISSIDVTSTPTSAVKRQLTKQYLLSARASAVVQVWNGGRLDSTLLGQPDQQLQLFLITSASAQADSDSAEGDFFVASLANIVYPAATYAYFTARADYSEKHSNSKTGIDFSVGASATGMASVFTRLFQFKDENQDGKYSDDDTIVDEYQFAEDKLFGHFPQPKPAWDVGDFSAESKTMTIKTKDGVFAVTLKANEQAGTTPGGSHMTPMNTKMDVEINYDKYKPLQAGNLVGLEAFVVATEADVDATVQAGNGVYIKQSDENPTLGFTWDGEASVEEKDCWLCWLTSSKAEVKASIVAGASLDEIKSNGLITGGMGAKTKVDSGGKLTVQKITYAFKSSKAGKIFWDPTVGASSEDSMISKARGTPHCAMIFIAALLPVFLISLDSIAAV